ncbi:fimbrial protein [Kalamiella sp. sgz302252]|uniref:fimbrial protein n=1 Tax=Pantoea sp. sgz302252 TaxID=3341827 RepID=UPI0036D3E729
MKKLAISTLSAVAVLAALNTNALAADTGIVNFTGDIISPTCAVVPADGTYNVPLPAVSVALLSSAGDTTDNIGFTISLTECNTATNNVYAFFEAGPNVNADGKLTNNGSAGNVAVELVDANGNVINVGSEEQAANPATVAVSDGSASLSYSARYIATGAATAGSIDTSVTYSIAYL